MKQNKQIKRIIVFLSLILLILSCSENNENSQNSNALAQEYFVDISTAKRIATNIKYDKTSVKNSITGKKNLSEFIQKTISEINEIKDENLKTSFYVINYVEGGFLLLSSDKRTTPVLGFSEKGKFVIDENSYPLGLRFWVNDTKKQIKEIQNSKISQTEVNKKAWDYVKNTVLASNQNLTSKLEPPQEKCYEHNETLTIGPLLSSHWTQTGGYNDSLPFINCYGNSFQVYAGCVPIAMAQVMRYYQYPSNYNWSSMPLNEATTATADFIKDIHNAINIVYPGSLSYSCDDTGVLTSADMGNVLKTKFGFSYATYGGYDYNTVRTNLDYNRPVILAGSGGAGGHMWVCDGYMQTSYYYDDCTGVTLIPLFHMNWGWGKNNFVNYDGYYQYNNFNPGNMDFNNNKRMIYNIIP